jgi:hypothetical protein
VPIFTRSGGLQAPAPHVSDMPHSSASGIPIAWKNSSTSCGVGAAPTLTEIASSRPSIERSPANSSRSASSTVLTRSDGTSSPACSSSTLRIAPASQAWLRVAFSPCSRNDSIPALSFSQIRGTAKNHVGRTAGR